jgi:hypothetical protein
MDDKRSHPTYDVAAWYKRQVHSRTRAALNERGSHADTHSREYKTEYKLQQELFIAERRERKRRKREKYLARVAKQQHAEQIGA